MPLWRLTPAAGPEDPRWIAGPIWAEVIVRAPLASQARVAAAEMEARGYDYAPVRNHAALEATAFPSAFFDEKLYHAERVDDPAEAGSPNAPTAGPGAAVPETRDDGLPATVLSARLLGERAAD